MLRIPNRSQRGPYLDFCILGAPKSGKTALRAYLRTHSQVFIPEFEPNFYADDRPEFRPDKEPKDWQAYCKIFSGAAEGQLLGEMSGLYLFSERAVPNILRDNPQARFIVMLRHPVDMAHARHSMLVRSRYEDESQFEKAWELQDVRAAGERIPRLAQKRLRQEPNLFLYREKCSFASQMERIFQRVPREQLLVHIFEEFFADLKSSYERTLVFLGLPDDGRRHFERVDEHTIPRSRLLNRVLHRPPFPLNRLSPPIKRALNAFGLRPFAAIVRANTKKEKPAPMDVSFRRRLESEFQPEIARLEAILGRNLDIWKSN